MHRLFFLNNYCINIHNICKYTLKNKLIYKITPKTFVKYAKLRYNFMWIVLGKPKGDIMKKISIIIVCVLLVLTCSLTACNQESEPLYYGLDMEIAQGLAQELGMELVIINWLNFDTICTEVSNYTNGIVMAGLTYSEKRAEIVNFSSTYYSASQKIIVKASDTTFDACTTAAEVEAILNGKTSSYKIGTQKGTTGTLYVEGSADWGFTGFPTSCHEYNTAALAAQDLINGTLSAVVVDAAPAEAIVKNINKLNGNALKLIDVSLTSEEYAYAVNPNNTELLTAVNAYLAKIKENGTFATLMAKYFEGKGTPTGVAGGTYDPSKKQLVVLTNVPFSPFEYLA